MRIVGHIDHPVLKITVFRNDNKLSVKFESGLYEQTYKFRDGEGIDAVDDVCRLVDDAFIASVFAGLQHMHETRISALTRQIGGMALEEFEEII